MQPSCLTLPHSTPGTCAPKPALLTALKQMNLMRPYEVKSLHSHTVSSSEWENAEATGIALQKAPASPGKWAWKWHISIRASFSGSKWKVISFGGNNPQYKITGSKLSLTAWKPTSALITKGNGWKRYPRRETCETRPFMQFCVYGSESIVHLCAGNKWHKTCYNCTQVYCTPSISRPSPTLSKLKRDEVQIS